VLQGWSKSTISGRVIGVAFIAVFSVAAMWGLQTLLGWHH
jgi:hypothetical protein